MYDLWLLCHSWSISTPVPLPLPYLMLALELHSLNHWQLFSIHKLNDSFFIDKSLKGSCEKVAFSRKNDAFKVFCKSKLTDNVFVGMWHLVNHNEQHSHNRVKRNLSMLGIRLQPWNCDLNKAWYQQMQQHDF